MLELAQPSIKFLSFLTPQTALRWGLNRGIEIEKVLMHLKQKGWVFLCLKRFLKVYNIDV